MGARSYGAPACLPIDFSMMQRDNLRMGALQPFTSNGNPPKPSISSIRLYSIIARHHHWHHTKTNRAAILNLLSLVNDFYSPTPIAHPVRCDRNVFLHRDCIKSSYVPLIKMMNQLSCKAYRNLYRYRSSFW